ncbi:uncharacterized protein PG986_005643 [Apiospora aurea]|uniref:Uncharacterized protein n=1 Tax=Apiospora aurea TaxID=335848 RepID=A0ABR1QI57_9PEZI
MQFTNLTFVLQDATIAAAAAIPVNGASDALLDKRDPKVEVDVQQSSYCITGTFGCNNQRTAQQYTRMRRSGDDGLSNAERLIWL